MAASMHAGVVMLAGVAVREADGEAWDHGEEDDGDQRGEEAGFRAADQHSFCQRRRLLSLGAIEREGRPSGKAASVLSARGSSGFCGGHEVRAVPLEGVFPAGDEVLHS